MTAHVLWRAGLAGWRRRLVSIAVAFSAALALPSAQAAWPERPIQLIFPSAPGGIASDWTRFLAEQLTPRLGQPVVVVDKPGAGGLVAFQGAKTAKPDGYTLVIGHNPFTTLPLLTKSSGYQLSDFVPISLAVIGTNVIVVPADSPIRNFADLRAQSKAQPGKLTYASAGVGTTIQLAGAWFDSLNGSSMLHLPYKGMAPALMALMSNEASVMFSSLSAMPHVSAGKLRAIALMSDKPSPFAPGVPTTAELGMPEFVVETFYGVLAPAGTPNEVVDRLQREIAEVMASSVMQAKLKQLLLQPSPDPSSAYFARRLAQETERWRKVIADHNIRMD